MITMTRRLTFSSAHANWVEEWPPEENALVYGTYASREPYGHNYLLDVSVQGDIDSQTGILVNIKEIDAIVRERVVEKLHRRTIAEAVPAFKRRPLTLESLMAFIAGQLREHMPASVILSAIELVATPTYRCRWERRQWEQEQAMLLTRSYEFAASHRLHSLHLTAEENRALFGKCNYENGHGHNYEVEVTVAGPLDPCSHRVIDPDRLDTLVHTNVVDRYDHRHLNYDIPEFEGLVPSAEVITRIIWERLVGEVPAPARLYRVLLRETPRNIFEYFGEPTGTSEELR